MDLYGVLYTIEYLVLIWSGWSPSGKGGTEWTRADGRPPFSSLSNLPSTMKTSQSALGKRAHEPMAEPDIARVAEQMDYWTRIENSAYDKVVKKQRKEIERLRRRLTEERAHFVARWDHMSAFHAALAQRMRSIEYLFNRAQHQLDQRIPEAERPRYLMLSYEYGGLPRLFAVSRNGTTARELNLNVEEGPVPSDIDDDERTETDVEEYVEEERREREQAIDEMMEMLMGEERVEL